MTNEERGARVREEREQLNSKMTDEKQTFGINIRKEREKSGLSRDELADEVYVSSKTIRNIELGVNMTNIAYAIMLANFFNVSIDGLCGREYSEETKSWI